MLGRPGAVFVDGEIAGTWRPKASGKKLTIALDLFSRVSADARDQIGAESRASRRSTRTRAEGRRPRSSGTAPVRLHLAAASLRVDAALLSSPRRTGGTPCRGRRLERIAQQRGQSGPGRGAVLPLRTMLGRRDHQDAVVDARGKAFEDTSPLQVAQGGRADDVPAQFDAAVGRVDALAARPGRAAEPLDEFGVRHDQPVGNPARRSQHEVGHDATLAW